MTNDRLSANALARKALKEKLKDPSLARVPGLPPELLALILSPRYLKPDESIGIPLVCSGFYLFGQALLWHHLKLELATPYVDPAMEALLDQPRFRKFVEFIEVSYHNTAVDRGPRAARHVEALGEL
ncbi:hypothetical protein MNV49_002015 [Pseudohyphozyma bogoriensis]|nr:hypothetical protein MNV49_002015 [Pseudohyphozyma bogoriensis]